MAQDPRESDDIHPVLDTEDRKTMAEGMGVDPG
jgi:hypothetical protein